MRSFGLKNGMSVLEEPVYAVDDVIQRPRLAGRIGRGTQLNLTGALRPCKLAGPSLTHLERETVTNRGRSGGDGQWRGGVPSVDVVVELVVEDSGSDLEQSVGAVG